MYFTLSWSDEPFDTAYPYFAYQTLEEAERVAEAYREDGDDPIITEHEGTLILPSRYGEGKRIER